MFSIQLSKNVSRIFNKKIIAYSLNNFTRITSIKCQDFNDKKTWFKFYPDNNLEHIKNENKKVRQYLTNYQSSDQYISIQSDYYSLSAIFFWYFFREDFLRYKLGVFKEEELNYSSGNYMKHILYVINLYSKPKAKDRPKNLELYYDLFKSLI